MRAHMRAFVKACLHACVRAYIRACVLACLPIFVRVGVRRGGGRSKFWKSCQGIEPEAEDNESELEGRILKTGAANAHRRDVSRYRSSVCWQPQGTGGTRKGLCDMLQTRLVPKNEER